MKHTAIVAIALFIVFLVASCSGTGSQMTMPPTELARGQESHSGPLCLGAWQIAVNKATGNVDIYQSKSANLAINVLGFLEPPPLVNLTIDFDTLVIEPDNELISVDVLFRHPIPDPVFNGFDVRGIVFGPDLLNADGYTPFMNPDDFSDVPFGYFDGLLGAPDSFANYGETLNGYKYFCDDLDIDDGLAEFFLDEGNLAERGMFSQGSQNGRHYDLSWVGKTSPIDFFIFNYAVYANYDWPVGDPPIDLENFSITSANSAEPFCFSASASENTLYFFEGEGGGDLTLDVEIWDWQGFASTEVTIEAPEFGGSPILHDTTSPGNTSTSQVFTFTQVEGTPTSLDDIEIIVTTTDQSETFGSYWFHDLMQPDHPMFNDYVYAAWKTSVTVSEESPLSFSVFTDAPYTRDTAYGDYYPGLITNASGYVYLIHLKTSNSTQSSMTYDYIMSVNSGTSWTEPSYGTFGSGSSSNMHLTFRDTSTTIGGDGLVYYTSMRNSASLFCRTNTSQNSGIFVPDSDYGTAMIFTHDDYAVPVGDRSGLVRCKKNITPNACYYGGSWTAWSSAPYYTVAPSPSRLSRVKNWVRLSTNELYVVYFSATTADWIRMSISADGSATSWDFANDVYDGTSDGYDVARDPGLFLDDDGTFYCTFILHTSSPSSMESIAYVTSTNGTDWSDLSIAHEVAGINVLQDPTLKVFDQDGMKIMVLTYQENDEIYLTFSWDDGVTWQTPTLLSGTDDAAYPDFTLTDDDYVHVVWQDDTTSYGTIEYIRVSIVED